MITFDEPKGDYRIATVLTRGVDTSTLTGEEFVKIMAADLKEADKMYKDIAIPEAMQKDEECIKRHYNETKSRAEAYAGKRWKTGDRRAAYVEREMEKEKKWAEDYRAKCQDHLNRLYDIFFDFNPKPDQGIPGVCVVDAESSDSQLERCYDELTATKYWLKAKGWVFKYECHKESVKECSRPWIEYILSPEDKAMWKAEQKGIDDAIMAFYAGKKSGEYVGD